MHTPLDHLFLAVILIFSVLELRWLWPRAIRAITSGVPGARIRLYAGIIASEWLFTLCVVGFWLVKGRTWTALMLGHVGNWQIISGLVYALLVWWLLRTRNHKIFSQPDKIEKVRQRLAFAEPLMPHTVAENKLFGLVSLTAGFCEEVLFRGFVFWYFAIWSGPLWAAVFSSIVFGFGHIYLGWQHMIRTGLFGLVLAFLVLALHTLWPLIIIHAAVDLTSGNLAFRVLNTPSTGASDSMASISA
jgi:membrane protease YdiL (CAAX protease family)